VAAVGGGRSWWVQGSSVTTGEEVAELRQPGLEVWPGEQSAYLVAAAAMAAYHVGLPASGRLVVAGGG